MSISAQFFTTKDISSLPLSFAKFEGNRSEHLGQLSVTPEMIANKIEKMKYIINHLELMGYHLNCLRKLLSKLVHH